jgi:predicted amidophosphoribosyltransferase
VTVVNSFIWQPVLVDKQRSDPGQWFTWILSLHYQPGGIMRTEYGELLYQAKYQGNSESVQNLMLIVQQAIRHIDTYPISAPQLNVDAVMAVPFYGVKDVSLPHLTAEIIAETLGIPNLSTVLQKTKPTPPAKLTPIMNPTPFEISIKLNDLHILLVDDLFRTGSTLESVSTKIRESGAKSVTGFYITKAMA